MPPASPPRGHWQWLQTFLVVTTRERGCCWHLVLPNVLQCLGQPYNSYLVKTPGLGQCVSAAHISCYDRTMTCTFLYLLAILQMRKSRLGEVLQLSWEHDALSPGKGGGTLGSGLACKSRKRETPCSGGSGDPVLAFMLVAPPGFPA